MIICTHSMLSIYVQSVPKTNVQSNIRICIYIYMKKNMILILTREMGLNLKMSFSKISG